MGWLLNEAEQNRLIVGNMDLVPTVAADFRGGDLDFEELLAAGRLGLVKAARSFDPSRGAFSGRASVVIRDEILMALRAARKGEPAQDSDSDRRETVAAWHSWGAGGNVRAIHERWEALEASPEELWGMFEDIEGERERYSAAFISLSQNQRKLIRWVFLDEQGKSIASAARELGLSYKVTIRTLHRALATMRQVFERMDAKDTALEAV